MNRDFIARAPREVIEKEEKKQQDFIHSIEKLQHSLQMLVHQS
jgi:valyl-tRNA synthetase